MAYITRELERMFLKLNDFFKVILDRYLGIYRGGWHYRHRSLPQIVRQSSR